MGVNHLDPSTIPADAGDAGEPGSARQEGNSALPAREPEPFHRKVRFTRQFEAVVETQLTDHLMEEGASVETGHAVLAALLLIFFWGHVPLVKLAVWLGTVFLVIAARRYYRLQFRGRRGNSFQDIRPLRLAVVAGALAWALGPLLLAPHASLPELLLMLVVFAGLVAAATATLVADPGAFYVFLAGTLGPMALGLLRHGTTRLHVFSVILLGLYSIIMVRLYRQA
ncbi:MAG TPA: hypothetical protein VLA15_00995, partial [Desulfurivibrionaceae bacterium]|nr:hypothetical protein [Desulfurivibrionaceae bacterium]